MRFLINDGCFTYEVDWSKQNNVDGGFIEEYRPELDECIDSFLRLLENVFPAEKIASYIAEGIDYSRMTPKDSE